MAQVSSKPVQSQGVMELMKRIEEGSVSDEEIRSLMKTQIEKRLQWGYKPTFQEQLAYNLNFAHSLRKMDIAKEIGTLDEQLYEVPTSFMKLMLGKSLKQSCCYFKDEYTTLDEAEIAMLDLCCERAHITDGQSVLDLGCGQGCVTLHIAQKYKNCHVTAVTNSRAQKDYVEDQCKILQLSNVKVVLADLTKLEMKDTFDRIIIISVFEHMKNYELLLKKISKWMGSDGLLYLEHLCHKLIAYSYEPIDEEDWYTESTFPAGTLNMPSASFFLYFQDDVSVVDHWILSGKHFARTMEEFLKKLDKNKEAAKEILVASTGSEEVAMKLINFWRGFCIREAEVCKYNDGEEWMLSQLLFKKK